MSILAIIAAILLPPLGVYIARRSLGPAFWVSVLLTLIGWVPGVIFALVVIAKPDVMPARISG